MAKLLVSLVVLATFVLNMLPVQTLARQGDPPAPVVFGPAAPLSQEGRQGNSRYSNRSQQEPDLADLRQEALGLTGAAASQALGWPTINRQPPPAPGTLASAVPNELPPGFGIGDLSAAPGGQTASGMPQAQETPLAPSLSVAPAYLTFFAPTQSAAPNPQQLMIRNLGPGSLSYQLQETIPWLSLNPTAGEVTMATDQITVSVDSSGLNPAASPYTGVITVANQADPAESEDIWVRLSFDPAGGYTTLYSNDANGNVQRRIDANGAITDYEYDALNRLIAIRYPDGSLVTYEYDGNGNRVAMTDSHGTTNFIYDYLNRLTSVIYPGLNPVLYAYDDASRLTSLTYPDGRQVSYGYDADGRLISVADASGTTSYGYDPLNGLLANKSLPNGISTAYGYDQDGRLTEVVNNGPAGLISRFSYTLDANGNRTRVVKETPGGIDTTMYAYDALNRLVEVTYPDGKNVAYDYDPLGNRTSMTTTVGAQLTVTDYTYDADNRLTRAGNEFFFYDPNGTLVRRTAPGRMIDYQYDFENRLVRYEDSSRVVEFEYDGLGNRLAKTVDGIRTNYINDLSGPVTQVLSEADAEWNTQQAYSYGLDRIQAADSQNLPSYYLYDSPLRSVVVLADASGAITAEYDYDAFGAPLVPPAGGSHHLYNGEQFDSESGLIYLRARYYDPALGRFLGSDTFPGILKAPDTLNPYVYASNNPINLIDITGLWGISLEGNIGVNSVIGSGADVSASLGPQLEFPSWNPLDWRVGLVGGVDAQVNTGPQVEASIYEGATLSIWNESQPIPGASDAPVTSCAGIAGSGTAGLGVGGSAGLCTGQGQTGAEFSLSLREGAGGGGSAFLSIGPDIGLSVSPREVINSFQNLVGDLGGVTLNETAALLLSVENIAGATYDPAFGQLILYGQHDVTLPEMDLDDVAVAVNSVYSGTDPGVSIDPPVVDGQFTVRYEGQTEFTEFGWVMFESDRIMKGLSTGRDNITGEPVTSTVPGYMSLTNRELNGDCAGGGESGNRFWFQPKEVRLVESSDGKAMVFYSVIMEVLTEHTFNGEPGDPNPEAEAFATHLTEHYAEFASEIPILKDLERLARIVAVVKWIKDNNIPLDTSFLDNYLVEYFDTPETTPALTFTVTQGDCSITVTGGVSYQVPNEYLADGTGDPVTGGFRDAALESRPAEEIFSWDFQPPAGSLAALGQLQGEAVTLLPTDTLTAVSQTFARTPKDGNSDIFQTDLSFPVAGDFDLEFTRYYNSFWEELTGFGRGWSEVPFQLLFPQPRRNVTFGSDPTPYPLYPQLLLVDRLHSREDIFYLGGIDPSYQPLYYRPDSVFYLRENTNGSFIRLEKDQSELHFDAAGRLTRVLDRNDNETIFSYNGDRLITIGSGSRMINLNYDGNGRISRSAGPQGHSVSYSYNSEGLLSAATDDQSGQSYTYQYDTEGNLAAAFNPEGLPIFSQGLDVYGRLTDQLLGQAAAYDFTYSLADRQTITTDTLGLTTTEQFDDRYRLLDSTNALGHTTAMSYATAFGPSSITDGRHATTQFTYDSGGNLTQILDAAGLPVDLYYDFVNPTGGGPYFPQLFAMRDARGVATGLESDQDGNLTKVYDNVTLNFDPSGNFTGYSYNPERATIYAYDAAGNLVSVIDPENNGRALAYDNYGQLTGITEMLGMVTNYQYDALSRLTEIERGGRVLSFGYDAANDLTEITTQAGAVQFEYDDNHNLTGMVDALGRNTQFSYDADNNLLRVVDARTHTTDYVYDAYGNIISATLPNGTVIHYEYDELGRLIRVTSGVGASLDQPAIAINPSSLSQTLPPDQVGTQTLTIENVGQSELEWAISESRAGLGTLKQEPTRPPIPDGQTVELEIGSVPASDKAKIDAIIPMEPEGTNVALMVDDSVSEDNVGLNSATTAYQFLWFNRFTPNPADFPFSLNQIWVKFDTGVGVNVGDLIDLVVYEDADGDPNTGATWLATFGVTVAVVDGSTWSSYNLPTPITLDGPGDVLIGVINRFVQSGVSPRSWPAALDETASQGRSWIASYAAGDPPIAPFLPSDGVWGTIDSYNLPGNWMVRGYGERIEGGANILYENGPLINSPGTGVGDSDESVLQDLSLGMGTLGFNHGLSAGFRLADNFAIDDPEGWQIDSVKFYAYQTNSGSNSTITAVNYQIWDGPPNDPNSNVVFGDTKTNRLVSSTWSGIYRVNEQTSGDNIDRPIMASKVSAGLNLPPGTYWLDWQADGSLSSGPWAPPITIDGQSTTGDALQFTPANGWLPVVDAGSNTAQGFPFLIEGSQLDPCEAGDIPWLSAAPTTGTLDAGQPAEVAVSFDSHGLAPGTYWAAICLYSNDPQNSVQSVPITLTIEESLPPPSAPTLQSPGNGSSHDEGTNLTLVWNSAPDATEYYAEYWGGPAGTISSGWKAATSWLIGAEWAGYTYSWHVKDRNASGESGWSDTWTFTVRPAAPSNLSAQAVSCSQVNLSWTDNSGNEEGYKIYRNGSFVGQVGTDFTIYQDMDVNENTTYSYYVKAFRGDIESDPSTTADVSTPLCNNPPNVPASPSPADGATDQDVNLSLSWTGGDPDAGDTVTYDVYLDTANPPLTLICDDVTAASCTPPNSLADDTDYYWKVIATDSQGASTEGPVWHFKTSGDLIFADGFESGDFSGWTSCVTDGGDLSVTAQAALAGSYSMQALIDDNVAVYCIDDTPGAEPRYRARFHFDPNSIPMASGNAHYILSGYSGTSALVLRLELRFYNGSYQLRASQSTDSGTWPATSWFTISDAPHFVELDWRAATAAGANDGGLTLWIDGLPKADLTGTDNDTRRIDRVRLGAVALIDTGTRGTYYFDAFESRRQTYIGPATVYADFSAAPTQGGVPLTVAFTDLSQSPTPITAYLWDFGDNTTSAEANPVHTYTAEGTYTVTLTATSGDEQDTLTKADYITASNLIFADGFESGDLSAWSSKVTDGGDLSAGAACALVGNYGMHALIDDNTSIYVDDHPASEPRYRARFYFDPNSIGMASGNAFYIFNGYAGASTAVFRVEFRFYNGAYQLRTSLVDDATTWRISPYYTITDGTHFLELDWQAATAAGANDGGLTFWIDGVQKADLIGVDNDTRRIDQVRLGAVALIDSGTRGAICFDEFESRRDGYIGPAEVLADFTAEPTQGSSPLTVQFTNASQPADRITAYLWDFGDGTTSTETDPVHIYSADGAYTVSLTATMDSQQNTMTKTEYIQVTEVIFADGFESGDLSAWDGAVTDGGDLSVAGEAALVGNYSMQAVIDDTTAVYVQDNHPNAEPRYRARFYFDPNSISVASGNAHYILIGYAGTSTGVLRVEFRFYNGAYQVRTSLLDDATTWKVSPYYTISDGTHFIELDWRAASAADANDGGLTLWIDGVQKADLTGVDNDTRRIDQVRLGAVALIDTGTLGTTYFDAFESRRQSFIGP